MPGPTRSPLPRSGRLVLWGNAFLVAGDSPDLVTEHAPAGDPLHRVVGVPGEDGPVSVAVALGRLRAAGVTALRLVLPEPGDPLGLPGPAAFTADAVTAGEVVLTVGTAQAPTLALLPSTAPSEAGDVVRWDVVPVAFSAPPHGLPTLSEAERQLAETMTEATTLLASSDLARGRAEVADALAALERRVSRLHLPATLPARAQRAVVSAARILGILDIALGTPGADLTSSETALRVETLRRLRAIARHALCAAVSALAEPEPVRKAWQAGR